ncbi:MAG: outer membrane lipoprotein carrier protein LolA [Holophagaceae bacterium]
MVPWAVPAPVQAAAQAPRAAPAALPAWWKALAGLPGLEARFSQASQSDVFGRMVRKGALRTARGGRLRVAYDSGLLLVSDGRALVHYDPEARTAQRLDLRAALLDMPLLNLLVDPVALPEAYQLVPAGDGAVLLKPRRPGLPEVRVEGRGQAPTRLRWKDGTGAEQELRLEGARPSAAAPPAAFQFTPPKGTRWLR